MKFRALALCAAVLVVPFAAACGGDDDTNSGSRPTVEEIKGAFVKELDAAGAGLDPATTETMAQCVADELHGSKLPNGVLRKLVNGEEAQVDSDNKGEYEGIIEEASTTCASQAVGQP